MAIPYVPDPELLGRRRFLDNKSFRQQLYNTSISYLSQIQGLLASDYPQDPSTNLAIFNRVLAREMARLNLDGNAINNDKDYTTTRPEFLQEILGERLLLGPNIAPQNYNSESYRNYLVSIKNAYLAGSRLTTLEALASKFTGLSVNIKELYIEARDPGSSLDVSVANKMIVQIFVDDMLKNGYNINTLKYDLDFFINLARPAHVLYNTELIWTEHIDVNKVHDVFFGDLGGGCIPDYDYIYPDDEHNLLALRVFILPGPTGATGHIDSIHLNDLIFYFEDSTRVITEPGIDGTQFYDLSGRRVSFNALQIGQYVRMTYQIIPGDFQFWNYPSLILPNWPSRFYRNIYRLPLFQETVKKIMDSHGRFSLQTKTTPTTICDRWVQDALQPMYEDLRGNCSGGTNLDQYTVKLSTRMSSPNFSLPYTGQIYDKIVLGSNFIHFAENTPLTDGSSLPATVSDVSVVFDGTGLTNSLTAVDASSGRITLNDTTTYWDSTVGRLPVVGNEFIFSYHYLVGGTNYDATSSMVYGISHWQSLHVPMVEGDGVRSLADTTGVAFSVDGTSITNAVVDVDPLLGHITLQSSGDFWRGSEIHRLPTIGDTFEFDYYWGVKLQYGLFFDELGRTLDGYISSQQVFNLLMDCTSETDFIPYDDSVQIGYRYRMYQLHHSSVLNSPDTLLLNGYQKPGTPIMVDGTIINDIPYKASIINQQPALNHFNVVWSAEFLTDKNTPVLNDSYLSNGLTPVVQLNYGTPTFQQTFAYQPGLIYQDKLQDIRKNHKLLMYSDLLLKQTETGDPDVPLSPVCDGEKFGIEIQMKEDVPLLEECDPWILFDSASVTYMGVDIPGETQGVPNLRIEDKHLRENFILREFEPTGTAMVSFSTHSSKISHQTTYQFPAFIPFFYNDEHINFPSLPVVNASNNLATASDITVTVDGIPWVVTSINPITGVVILDNNLPLQERIEQTHRVTAAEEIAKQITLHRGLGSAYSDQVTLTIIRGTSQYLNQDFSLNGPYLSWMGSSLDGLITAGDYVRISYWYDPLVDADIEFIYRIRSHQDINVMDRDWSRIMDDKYVFPGFCADMEDVQATLKYDEFYGMLDDASDGIKIKFLNTNSLQIEEHIFSGPLFEMYDASLDQIGAPDNFPDALIRINNPISINNPLNYSADFSFMNDKLVRFRKKTFKELLSNNTFRTMQLTEMLPV